MTEITEKIEKYQRPSYKLKQKIRGKVVNRIQAKRIDNIDYFVYTLKPLTKK